MSFAGLIMDVVLMGLLVAALLFGVRLDRRLKGLRDAHDTFARAVADLDQAAITAHTSLKALRADADDSQELLHGRILAARDLVGKLEAQIARAEKIDRDIGRTVEAVKDAPPVRFAPLVATRPEIAEPPEVVAYPDRDSRRFGALRTERPSPFKQVTKPETEDRPQVADTVLKSLNDMLRSFEVPKRGRGDDDLFDNSQSVSPPKRRTGFE